MRTDTEALTDAARLLRATVAASDHPGASLVVELEDAADTFAAWAEDDDQCGETHPARMNLVSMARVLLGEVT